MGMKAGRKEVGARGRISGEGGGVRAGRFARASPLVSLRRSHRQRTPHHTKLKAAETYHTNVFAAALWWSCFRFAPLSLASVAGHFAPRSVPLSFGR